MKDPWEKAYAYGRNYEHMVAHIVDRAFTLCGASVTPRDNHTPDPYPVCKNCLRTKRAKELGLS
ncbi:hypothetical protein LCGC14_0382570 [marine sediment metagenome]|uniref:Uncharacterized protein n=1 Tax=marine sediment metagenome TaxID=412755 RepID=A0A0F9WAS8_9ZZZZ